jgi:hypothetical protein
MTLCAVERKAALSWATAAVQWARQQIEPKAGAEDEGSVRVARDSASAGSSEAITSSNLSKSSGPPCAGSAQTSSSLKSGATSPIRQA